MASHWFERSQWTIPTAENYAWLRDLFGAGFLPREYEDLRREYEDLRRPFTVNADVPYTDVWSFPTVGRRAGKHPCEKPLAMMEHIIAASSRPGAVVLDPFMGSGVTGEAAIRLGRDFIGMESDAGYFAGACTRIRASVLNAQNAPATPREVAPPCADQPTPAEPTTGPQETREVATLPTASDSDPWDALPPMMPIAA